MSNGLDHIVFSKVDGAIRDAEKKMAEIDIRRDENEMVTKIWFSDQCYIHCATCMGLSVKDSDKTGAAILKEEVPDLIKALQKYMELYGEQ